MAVSLNVTIVIYGGRGVNNTAVVDVRININNGVGEDDDTFAKIALWSLTKAVGWIKVATQLCLLASCCNKLARKKLLPTATINLQLSSVYSGQLLIGPAMLQRCIFFTLMQSNHQEK